MVYTFSLKKVSKNFLLQAHKSLVSKWDSLNIGHCGSRMVLQKYMLFIVFKHNFQRRPFVSIITASAFSRVRWSKYYILRKVWIYVGTHFLMLRKFPTQCFEGGSVLKKWHEFRKSTTCHGDDHNIAKPVKMRKKTI